MTMIQHRESAPLTAETWKALEEAARDHLTPRCTARQFCSIDGPHGLDLAAVNTGELVHREVNESEHSWATRASLPMIESRRSFELPLDVVRGLPRGATDVDLGPLEAAADDMARFEDATVYHGCSQAGVRGLRDLFDGRHITIGTGDEDFVGRVGEARSELERRGFGEDLVLVVGRAGHQQLNRVWPQSGRSTRDLLGSLVSDEHILIAPGIEESLLLSRVGNPFVLTIGQDICLQYIDSDEEAVRFCFLETFTFRCLEPRAGVLLGSREPAEIADVIHLDAREQRA